MTSPAPRAFRLPFLRCLGLALAGLACAAPLSAASRESAARDARQREADAAAWEARFERPPRRSPTPAPSAKFPTGVSVRLPGEFESTRALLVACHSMIWDEPELFTALVAAAQPKVEIVAAVRNVAEYRLAQRLLQERSIPTDRVHFAELAHDTMWTRDYGPRIAERLDGKPVILDADYSPHARPADDAFPRRLARALNVPAMQVPLRVDGGNLLSNGRGLLVATRALLSANLEDQRGEDEVRRRLREFYGGAHVVFLEPLAGEPTGHVDMFATFPTSDTVVVGAYDPRVDPTNAQILDRNAARLAQVRTERGPLRVVRLPMPTNHDQIWRSYTNVVYANGVLLMPSFADLDPAGQQQAAALYRRLLPTWQIAPIDARKVAQRGGALHCVTMNLSVIPALPPLPPPRQIEAETDRILAIGY